GRPARNGAHVRVRDRDRGEAGLGLQPGTERRAPGHSAGRGLSEGRDARRGPPLCGAERALGRCPEARRRRGLPRLPPGDRGAGAGAFEGVAGDGELAIGASGGGRHEIAPLGAVGPRRDELKRGIGALVADGSTALYASARAGVTFLRSRADDSRINAVLLLTDGKNEDADRDLDGLLASLRTEDETARVRVFTIGYGDDADRTTLQKIAEASRAAFYDASKPATIDRVFRDVVSNF